MSSGASGTLSCTPLIPLYHEEQRMSAGLNVPGTDCPADSLTTAGRVYLARLLASVHAAQPDGDDAEARLDNIENGGDDEAWYAEWRAQNPGPDMAAVEREAAAAA